MCGILAILLADPAACASVELFEGLQLLQHRGQVENPRNLFDFLLSFTTAVLSFSINY